MKTMFGVLIALMLASVVGFSGTDANALNFTATSGNRSASADFEVVGGNLRVTLANISTSDVLFSVDVLTAVFFDIAGVGALTPVSASLSGSTVFFGPDGGGNIGGEWAYASGLSGAPLGATEGISSSGFDLFGGSNFGGLNLQGPTGLDGLQYGITSAGDNPATGNAPVTGGNALIGNSVVFTLSGLPGGFNPSTTNITNVSFQYGTSLTEPNVPVPEPATLLLLGSGLVGLYGYRKKFKK